VLTLLSVAYTLLLLSPTVKTPNEVPLEGPQGGCFPTEERRELGSLQPWLNTNGGGRRGLSRVKSQRSHQANGIAVPENDRGDVKPALRPISRHRVFTPASPLSSVAVRGKELNAGHAGSPGGILPLQGLSADGVVVRGGSMGA
jgi:hypothetical protein